MTKKASSLTNPPNSNNPKSKIRRSLIKGTGLVFAGSLGSFSGSYSANAKTTTKTEPVPQNLLNQALQIASKSALVIDYDGNTNSHNYNWASMAEDFEDGNSWTVLSAQVYPFCVFTPNGGWISYSFTRQGAVGKPAVWVGQAQILQGWCSWRTVS